jgi:predicted flap endonuclease-1-like 5' DNA nuclease
MGNYKIEHVEVIGPVIGNKFREAGIKDTDSLLENSKKPRQRKILAEKAGISPQNILRLASLVDLYRVSGIGSEYSELLQAAGVSTVPDLARRNPANLRKMLAETNAQKKLARRVPTEKEVGKWVAQAKTLPRNIEY